MKYYVLQGKPDKMENRMFKHLKQIEPGVEELTFQEYEERMGIKPGRVEEKKVEDVGQAMGANTATAYEAPVSFRSKKEYRDYLEKERGIDRDFLEGLKTLEELKNLV